jgi:hypothetical protein
MSTKFYKDLHGVDERTRQEAEKYDMTRANERLQVEREIYDARERIDPRVVPSIRRFLPPVERR